MRNRELPVLNFGSFRKYPTKDDRQEFSTERDVCNHCISGVCCVNQDAIALSSFDIFRLAAFFDMSPASFMLTFTQDKFEAPGDEEFRRNWNRNPKSSVVTWLRRRTSSPWSPCIFLKYVRDPDGTPRRICSVHDARPLSCREYYFVHCKTRGTGELASLLAEGFEKVRDGEITHEIVDTALAKFDGYDFTTSSLAESMEHNFWIEMKCVLNMDQANVEGSNSYILADYQDPIDEKVNRVLSSKYLRSEESYGWKPRDEQLMPYTSGLGFVESSEYRRIMKIAETPSSDGLFGRGSYPYYVGLRTMVRNVRHSERFPTIPQPEINSFLRTVPNIPLFSQHSLAEVRTITLQDLYNAVLRAFNYVLRFASHIASLEPILECDPPGTIETEMFNMLVDFETSLNPFIAKNPYLESVKSHMAKLSADLLERQAKAATRVEDLFDCLKSLTAFQQTMWRMPADVQRQISSISVLVQTELQKRGSELQISEENPIEKRREAGKRIGLNEAYQAWGAWYSMIMDTRCASMAGLNRLDLPTFYRKTVSELEKLPFRQSYASCLFDIIKYLAQGMTLNHRISYQDMPYQDAADRLAAYAIRLFDWKGNGRDENEDCELLADFLIAVYKDLGRGLSTDENAGVITYRVLASQLTDGSWKTDFQGEDAPDDQGEFLDLMYRPTWTCLNALRPTKNDAGNPANAALGLV